jgi:chromosome segregation ATPase
LSSSIVLPRLKELEANLEISSKNEQLLRKRIDTLQSTIVANEESITTLKFQLEEEKARIQSLQSSKNVQSQQLPAAGLLTSSVSIDASASFGKDLANRQAEAANYQSHRAVSFTDQDKFRIVDPPSRPISPSFNGDSYDKLKSQIELMQLKLSASETDLVEKSREIDLLKDKQRCFDLAEQHLSKMKEQLDLKTTRLEELEVELYNLRDTTSKQLAERLNNTTKAQEEVEKVKKQEKEFLEKVETQNKTKIDDLKAKITALEEQLANQTAAIKDSKSTIKDLKGQLSEAMEENENSKSQIQELRNTKTSIQHTLEKRVKEKAELNQKLIDCECDFIKLKDKVIDVVKIIQEYESRFIKPKKLEDGTKTEEVKVDQDNCAIRLKEIFKVVIERIQKYKEEIESINEDLTNEKNETHTLSLRKKELLEKNKQLEMERDDLRQQIKKLKEEFVGKDTTIIKISGLQTLYKGHRDKLTSKLQTKVLDPTKIGTFL